MSTPSAGCDAEPELLGQVAGVVAEAGADVAGVVAVVGEQHRRQQELDQRRRPTNASVRRDDGPPRHVPGGAAPAAPTDGATSSTDLDDGDGDDEHDRSRAGR